MFGMPTTRIAELSRPDYARDLAEYARLEYPSEDARTVLLQALAAERATTGVRRRRFRLFGSSATRPEAVSAKA